MIPPHWSLLGPRRIRHPERLLRWRNVRGAHVATVHRLIRIGPWALMMFRYRPGHVEERP